MQLPMFDLGEGLYLIVGGFIAVDVADDKAVVITFVGGSTRTLTATQSEKFLMAIGLKESRVVGLGNALR